MQRVSRWRKKRTTAVVMQSPISPFGAAITRRICIRSPTPRDIPIHRGLARYRLLTLSLHGLDVLKHYPPTILLHGTPCRNGTIPSFKLPSTLETSCDFSRLHPDEQGYQATSDNFSCSSTFLFIKSLASCKVASPTAETWILHGRRFQKA